MNSLINSRVHINDKVWCTNYAYSYKGTKCTCNIEPSEYKITENKSDGRRYHFKGIELNKKKPDAEKYLPTYKLYATKEEAEKKYAQLLGEHVQHLLTKVSYFSDTATMKKRLIKYGLSELQEDMENLSNLALAITLKIDSDVD